MRSYEMMYILRPDLSDEQVKQSIEKYRNFLTEQGAIDIEMNVWGRRRLEYELKRFKEGIYILTTYKAEGKQVAPLERAMRLSEDVIRYLTIKLEEVKTKTEVEEPVAAEA